MQTAGRSPLPEGLDYWNKNPSFEEYQFIPNEPSLRTVDNHLADVARQAIVKGVLHDTNNAAVKVTANLQVTDTEGLAWSCNPTYSDNAHNTSNLNCISLELTISDEEESVFLPTAELISPAQSSILSFDHMPMNEMQTVGNVDDCAASVVTTGGTTCSDEGFEWMEIIKMKDVGVQTMPEEKENSNPKQLRNVQHRVEFEDQEIVMLFDEIINEVHPQSHPLFHVASLPNDDDYNRDDDGNDYDVIQAPKTHQHGQKECGGNMSNERMDMMEDWKKKAEGLCDESYMQAIKHSHSYRRNNSQEGGVVMGQTSKLSYGSDCFNNLPMQRSDSLCSFVDNKLAKQDVVVTCQQCSKKDEKLEAMENEMRELKIRMADLEIELCNKDSIIAQQDSIIYRYTSNLRSQRIHRRNFSTVEGRSSKIHEVQSTNNGVPKHVLPVSLFQEEKQDLNIDVQDLVRRQKNQMKVLMGQLEKCRFS